MSQISDCIIDIEDKFYNKKLYNRLIDYADLKCVTKAKIMSGLDTNIRDVSGYHLNDRSKTDKVLFKLIDKEISRYYLNLKAKFKFLDLKRIREVQLLKYEVGGKYDIHVDSYHFCTRELTCIINLNSDFEGGEFEFFNLSGKDVIKTCKNEAGKVIFFPSNFMFPHKVKPITSGKRYSAVIWLA